MTRDTHIRKPFDHWDAKNYSENSHMQYNLAMEALTHSNFQENDAILDIGCGDGRITALIAEAVPAGLVLGTDNSKAMIEHAKQFEKSHPNLSFLQREATQIDFSNKFNWITSFSCLHWIENQRLVWEKIHIALKSKGRAVVLFYKKHPYLWNTIDKMVNHSSWKEYFTDFHTSLHTPEYECSEKEYANILKSCGFQIECMEEETRMYDFKNREELQNFIAAWLPYLSRIPASQRNIFMHDLCEEYFQIIPPEASGKVKMPFTHRLFLVAK